VVDRMDILDRAEGASSKTELFLQLLALSKNRPRGDALASRTGAPLVRRMLAIINRRSEGIRNYNKALDRVRAEREEAETQLHERFRFIGSRADGAPSRPRVEGCFDAGVRIYADSNLMEEPNPPEDAMIVTDDSQGEVLVFVREDRTIVQVR